MTWTTMAVLCGGKGTRLGELTKSTPKSLIEVAGRPFLEWPLEHYASQGIQRVVLCIGHLGDQIQRHFGKSFAGMDIEYLPDNEHGHRRRSIEKPYWWTFGDTYLPVALGDPTWSRHWRIWNDGWAIAHPCGWIHYGLYYECHLTPSWRQSLSKEQRFYEIGTPAALAETRAYFAARLRDRSESGSCHLELGRRA